MIENIDAQLYLNRRVNISDGLSISCHYLPYYRFILTYVFVIVS